MMKETIISEYKKKYDYPINVIMATEEIDLNDIRGELDTAFEDFLNLSIFTEREKDVVHGYFKDKLSSQKMSTLYGVSKTMIYSILHASLRKIRFHEYALTKPDDNTTPIEYLELPTKLCKLLKHYGKIDTVEELILESEENILGLKGIGIYKCNEIKKALSKIGLKLRED